MLILPGNTSRRKSRTCSRGLKSDRATVERVSCGVNKRACLSRANSRILSAVGSCGALGEKKETETEEADWF